MRTRSGIAERTVSGRQLLKSSDPIVSVGSHTRTVARLQLQRFNYDSRRRLSVCANLLGQRAICTVQLDPKVKPRSRHRSDRLTADHATHDAQQSTIRTDYETKSMF